MLSSKRIAEFSINVVSKRRGLMFCLIWIFGLSCITVVNAAEAPTGRQTDDRHSDLIDALVDSGQFPDAEAICRRYLDRSPQGSQVQAVWTIRLSAVHAARLRSEAVEEPQPWLDVAEPVRALRTNYAGEPFTAWLKLQETLIELHRGEVLAMRSTAKPQDTQSLLQAEDVLRKTTESLRELESSIETTPSKGSQLEGATTEASQLRAIVRKKIIDGLLIRFTLYPPDSEDSMAAATEAERAAQRWLDVTGFDSPLREMVVRTWARARREAQDAKGAAELLSPWIGDNRYTDLATLAEWLLAEMERGNNDAVRQVFKRYYGDRPLAAAKSMELDLARLKFLITELQRSSSAPGSNAVNPEVISQWVEAIGQRNGTYARRLAETEMLRGMRSKPTEGNLTLIVAKAGQLIRGGTPDELVEAASLLDQAVNIAEQSDREADAFQFGVQAAAARAKAGQGEAAARAFAAISKRFPKQLQSPTLHFESAKLISKLVADDSQAGSENTARLVGLLENTLLDQIRNWPQSQQSFSAREWLMRIFETSSRYAEAAQVAASLPADSILWLDAVARTGELWRTAIANAPTDSEKDEMARAAIQRLATLAKSATELATQRDTPSGSSDNVDPELAGTLLDVKVRGALAGESNLIAVLTSDRKQLSGQWIDQLATEAVKGTEIQLFADDLRRIREQSFDPNRLALNIPKANDAKRIVRMSIERLRADGMSTDEFRAVAGKAILRLVGTSVPDDLEGQFNVAIALAWTNDWVEAATRIEAIAKAAKKNASSKFGAADVLQQGAIVLGGLSQPEAKRQALAMWNLLGAGSPAGNAVWHEAKLGAAQLLTDLGERQEAAKLARYVLLTKPPTDPGIKARYEGYAEQSP